jgi:NADH-quinone oxidoreductase subunit L
VTSAIRSVWLIPFFPLLGAILTAALGRRLGRSAHMPVILGIVLSFLVSLSLVNKNGPNAIAHHESAAGGAVAAPAPVHTSGPTVSQTKFVYDWIQAGEMTESRTGAAGSTSYQLDIPIEFRVDGLTVMMLCMVTFVAALVAIFAVGYMAGESGYARFFAEVGLFVFSMTGLVLSNNFVLTYAFWEGVGVCSYLLIGFWYKKPSAAAAAKKAFLVNRIGDIGFAIAIFWMWTTVFNHNLSYDNVLSPSNIQAMAPEARLGIALLLIWAATAKSAQIPLYVWLPDAMEGPTPVSALIHAATMVTAGVYLLARSAALIFATPFVPPIICVVGCLTALLSALMALTQNDLKRVLAYSTISQLGYMFMALGAGIGNVTLLAVVAAMFHLFTHAFFKALLFLGAGSVMIGMGHVIDMRRFGGLKDRMPITNWTFAIGGLSLAGIVPLAGFWSKDEILSALSLAAADAHQTGRTGVGWLYLTIYGTALFTAFLTAFYIGRAYFKTFWGPEKLPSPDDPEAEPDEHDHAHDPHFGHESPAVMTWPLIILAACTVFVGIVFGLPTGLFENWLERTPSWSQLMRPAHGPDLLSISLGTLVGLLGLGLSWAMYYKPSTAPERLASFLGGRPYRWSYGKFFVDELYANLVVKPTNLLATIAKFLDVYLVDGLVRLVAWIPRVLGRDLLAPIQNGLVQFYAGATALGVVLLLLVLLLT